MDIGNIVYRGQHIHQYIRDIRTIVLSGGKTGSETLFLSFNKCAPALFAHDNNNFQFREPACKINNINISDVIDYKYRKGIKLLVVSCYREPISRRISSFFQNITMHSKKNMNDVLSMDINELISIFIETCVELESYWPHMEKNFGSFGDINIFEKEFNKSEGYQTYENHKVGVLMLRFDKINDFERIIRSNTIYKNFELITNNVSNEKWYNELYKEFKQKIVIPGDKLDLIFQQEDQNLKYFYDDEYISGLKNF